MKFGMDYAVPGVLGGLGEGYVQPNLMYTSSFGSSKIVPYTNDNIRNYGIYFINMLNSGHYNNNDIIHRYVSSGNYTPCINKLRSSFGKKKKYKQ